MNNRFTLITGGSEGIGFELAKLFAKDKNNLILVARNKEKLLKVQRDIEKEFNNKVLIIDLDLSVDNSCEKLFDFVEKNNIVVD